jgi:3-methyladenine DNA glycosylase AlkD
MHNYLKPLQQLFERNADAETATGAKKYMRNRYEFYGIKSPLRKEIIRQFHKENGLPDYDRVEEIVKDCWQQPQREFQYFAMEMLKKIAKKAGKERIELYKFTIVNKSWWDTVDFIAANLVGTHLKLFPEMTRPSTSKWIDSDNMWLQRTAILFQLKYKKETDTALLSGLINKMQGSKEFFINKAVGWALREYSKTNAEWVINFTENTQLANLSKREALKWLNRKNS